MIIIDYTFTDANGRISSGNVRLGNLEIAKHFIFAGAGFVPRIDTLRKALAALTYFESFFPNDTEVKEFFLKPEGWEYDPTQVAHFSNIVGKALADKFFKKLVGGIVSFNYEAVMKTQDISISGKRPDLYGFTKTGDYVAIEAKGYSRTTTKRDKIKQQAESGSLHKDYSIASVTENIYSKISVDFYDPYYDDNLPRINYEEFVIAYYQELISNLEVERPRTIKHNRENYMIIGRTFFKGDIIYLVILSSIPDQHSLLERLPKSDGINYFIDSDGFGVFKANDNLELVTYVQNEN